eukprot:1875720-Rhodomonas_salina.1
MVLPGLRVHDPPLPPLPGRSRPCLLPSAGAARRRGRAGVEQGRGGEGGEGRGGSRGDVS